MSRGDQDADLRGCFADLARASVSPAAPTAQPPRIVVVSESGGSRRRIAGCLGPLGDVTGVADAEAADAEMRAGGRVSLVVATAGSLRADGLALVARLRSVPGHDDVPVLLVTPTVLSPDETDVVVPAGVDHLPAPAEPADLRSRAALLVDLAATHGISHAIADELTAALAQWRQDVLDSPVPTALLHTDREARVCAVNEAFVALVGGTADDWPGGRFALRVHREDAEMVEATIATVARGDVPRTTAAARWVGADQRTVRAQMSIARVSWPRGPRDHLRAELVVTSPPDAPEDVPRPGALDSLTGLPDRTLLLRQLRQALARARRSTTSVALLCADLDEFAHVEASRGRSVADELLVQAAHRLAGTLRPGDVVARTGRDEFVLLCEGVSSPAVARHIAERVRLAVPEVVVPQTREPAGLTASVGLAVSDGSDDPDQVVWQSQQALRRAKETGRDRTSTHAGPEPGEEVRLRLRRVLEARHGETRVGGLSLHYQPVIDLVRRRVVGVEALVRLADPERGLVLPGEFLPAAEEGVEVDLLAAWTLDEACRQLREWTEAFPGLTMSVNLTARQLTGSGIVDLTRGRLERHGLPPQALRVEVDERDLVDRMGHPHRAVTDLAALGVAVAVDRFGTGKSSLTSLRGMPVGVLKVDASLVHAVATSREGAAVVAALLTLGRALGLRTVAVGVETAEQEEALRALGCDEAQGYHLGAPQPAPQISALLDVASAGR